jgi:hypothetical protein
MKSFSNYNMLLLLAFAFVSVAVKVCVAQIEFTKYTIAENFLPAGHQQWS